MTQQEIWRTHWRVLSIVRKIHSVNRFEVLVIGVTVYTNAIRPTIRPSNTIVVKCNSWLRKILKGVISLVGGIP